MKINQKIYNYSIVVLALISIALVIFDFSYVINISNPPFNIIDNFILITFTIDYIVRFIISKNKIKFFKENIFDLIAIIPFDAIFSFFRIARLFRIAKIARLAKLTRAIGVVGKLTRNTKSFLNTNGFLNVIYLSSVLIVISAMIYSYAENVPYIDAFWWALVTTTTVGYGDISPATPLGRVAAIILMILGIGFIGMLTSTITEYFNKSKNEDEESNDKIELLINKIDQLESTIEQLKEEIKK
ncbi:ion transporter [Enterococcus faecalis]|uniref:ion transporter n=2 Tax=Enterococcus faecalis TaxID=1351 RepID=UPI0011417663|nr:potassium channel family protein [Enterococcus faecalis]EGO5992579.1 ion transporter [Enterococcus faecalis]MBP4097997.1 ion transporter [Enterococcus faecalis]MDH5050201.1 potassium channel family protein [Enterococcus faecalis]NSV46242.1 ion transporter [Enterococcus faecalis]NSW03223.1 ion transporter [Enterococcus faecalis]